MTRTQAMKKAQPTPEQRTIRAGDRVIVTDDAGKDCERIALSDPWQMGGHTWVVKLSNGSPGGYMLSRCRKVVAVAAMLCAMLLGGFCCYGQTEMINKLAHDMYLRGYADGCLDGWLMRQIPTTNFDTNYPPPEAVRRYEGERCWTNLMGQVSVLPPQIKPDTNVIVLRGGPVATNYLRESDKLGIRWLGSPLVQSKVFSGISGDTGDVEIGLAPDGTVVWRKRQ